MFVSRNRLESLCEDEDHYEEEEVEEEESRIHQSLSSSTSTLRPLLESTTLGANSNFLLSRSSNSVFLSRKYSRANRLLREAAFRTQSILSGSIMSSVQKVLPLPVIGDSLVSSVNTEMDKTDSEQMSASLVDSMLTTSIDTSMNSSFEGSDSPIGGFSALRRGKYDVIHKDIGYSSDADLSDAIEVRFG